MNIRHLEILEAIAQTGSFTKAAQALHLTQSAISHAIAELELQTKAPLFDRLPRGVQLTHCGQLLLEESQVLLTSYRSLEQRIYHLEEYTSIRIASSITIASFYLPQILKNLKAQLPSLKIQVQVVSASCAMDILQTGNADIALIEGAKPQDPFHSVHFGSYPLHAACAMDYPFAENKVTLSQLCSMPLLLREKGSAIRDTFDSILYLSQQIAQPLWESVNSTALLKATEAGLGVTILPYLLLTDFLKKHTLRLLEITDISVENKMFVVYHKEKYISHNLKVVLDLLGSQLSD